MSNLTTLPLVDVKAIEAALIHGDLSRLTPEQKLSYNKHVCESMGLNHLTKPFEYIRLNGKEVLYATKGCAEQLRSNQKISIKIVNTQKIDDVYIVTAEATSKDRTDSSTGVVSVAGLKGEALANALMKAETKAKRRVTLSICGLNMLDESEVESIPREVVQQVSQPAPAPQEATKNIFDDETIDLNPGAFTIAFGKFKGQQLSDIDAYELNNYLSFIKKTVQEKGKDPAASVSDFMMAAENYLSSIEVKRA